MSPLPTPPAWFPLGADGWVSTLAFATATLVAGLAAFPVRSLAARLGAIDAPGGRRVHLRPTARLGGIAVVLGVWIGAALALGSGAVADGPFPERWRAVLPILGATAFVCGVGAIDDVRGLRPSTKLLALAAAGGVLILNGICIEHVAVPMVGTFDLGWLAWPATILWVIACANAVNLIDGVDGAGAGVSGVAAVVLTLVAIGTGDPVSAVLFAAVAGGAAGFLFHNRHPARLFMGDSGSLSLGFLLAAISATGCTKRAAALTLVAALLALAVPFLDTGLAFARRFHRALVRGQGRRLLSALKATAVADRSHIHHRLLVRGLGHREVSRVLCLITLLLGVTALLLIEPYGQTRLGLIGGLLAGAVLLARLAALRGEPTAPAEPEVVLQPMPPRQPAAAPAPTAATPEPGRVATASGIEKTTVEVGSPNE
ncbi:MAG: MraY family glycosyltransferase [Planctomycetota bacterium]